MYELDSVTWNQLSDDWFQKIVITKLGQLRYEYHYKGKTGKLCVALEIEDHITKQINAYTLIEKDLRDSLSFLVEIEEFSKQEKSNNKGIILKALTRAIAITYGKCFTVAGGRKIKLDENIVSEKNRQAHKDIMEMRHQYVAHAGVTEHESCKCVLLLPPAIKFYKGQTVFPGHFTELYQTITPVFLVTDCKSLIEEVQLKVKDKLEKLWGKIDLSKISPTQVYEIVSKAKNKNRITLSEKDLKKLPE